MGGCPCDRRAIGESPPCLVGPGLESAWVIIDQDWAVLSWWLSLPSVIWRRLGLSRRSGLGVPGESSSRETSKLQGLVRSSGNRERQCCSPSVSSAWRSGFHSPCVGFIWKVGQVAESYRVRSAGAEERQRVSSKGRAVAVSGVKNTRVIQ